MLLIDRATFDDLVVDDAEREIHGRCGLGDGVCACPDSMFNRWFSGYITGDEKQALKRDGFGPPQYVGHPQFRSPLR